MKNKKDLIKWGSIFLTLYIVVGIISFILLRVCSASASGLGGIVCLLFSIPIFFPAILLGGYSNNLLQSDVNMFIFNGIFWIIAGVIIRLIYIKFKK